MKPHEWMVKYTPQTEWIKRRGILLWLAFFFIELGAGTFFIASFFGNIMAMVAGLIACGVIGGGLHLKFLGKPSRFWRMAVSSGWKTSWISRGLIFVAVFLILGVISILLDAFTKLPFAIVILTNIFAFLTVVYGGFAMNNINGIPLWNTAVLPFLYVVSGLWGGAEVTLGISLAGGSLITGISIEEWIRILLIGFILLVPIYLISVRYVSSTGEKSVKYMIAGKMALVFWIFSVVLGIAVPAVVVSLSFINGLDSIAKPVLYFGIICGLIGDLSTRYLILRCGLYCPIVPTSTSGIAV